MEDTALDCMSVLVTRSVEYYSSLWLPRDSTAVKRSGSYTRRRWDDDLKNSDASSLTNRTPSYQRRLAPPPTPPTQSNFHSSSDLIHLIPVQQLC